MRPPRLRHVPCGEPVGGWFHQRASTPGSDSVEPILMFAPSRKKEPCRCSAWFARGARDPRTDPALAAGLRDQQTAVACGAVGRSVAASPVGLVIAADRVV